MPGTRLRARSPASAATPAPPTAEEQARASAALQRFPAGESRLGLSEGRDGLVYLPAALGAATRAPLVVYLHGAGGDAKRLPLLLHDLADGHGLVVLAPESRGTTWDLAGEPSGPDLEYLRRAVDHVRSRVPVDESHLALAGFSDGASYALAVGLANAGVFTHVMAFSPGGPRRSRSPRPEVFISHGTRDGILPVSNARAIVERLRGDGFALSYREFEGGHEVPRDVAAEAIRWFLGR